jgi:IS5 family transposase
VTSREERRRELEELARKREEYWDRRREEGKRKQAVVATVMAVFWIALAALSWLLGDIDAVLRWGWTALAFCQVGVAVLGWRKARHPENDEAPGR